MAEVKSPGWDRKEEVQQRFTDMDTCWNHMEFKSRTRRTPPPDLAIQIAAVPPLRAPSTVWAQRKYPLMEGLKPTLHGLLATNSAHTHTLTASFTPKQPCFGHVHVLVASG